ncbi:MAG: MBL fold metallo-hydrolase [Magnetococcus sp. YQC-5]
MLRIHILNVGNGDSIIIEHSDIDNKKSFGVIDSNTQKGHIRALEKLIALGAEKLSFVCLTHPHDDHYLGLLEILKYFQGRIDRFWTCPLEQYVGAGLKQLSKVYLDIAKNTDDNKIRNSIRELVGIFKHIDETYQGRWDQITGGYNLLAPSGFSDVEFYALLPFLDSKGILTKWLKDGCVTYTNNHNPNHLSVAIMLKYHGVSLVLGGDASSANWNKHKRRYQGKNVKIVSQAIKLPHHGSKYDCTDSVMQYLFGSDEKTYALISADGCTHPDRETLDLLKKRKIKPYCTNFKEVCGNNISTFNAIPNGIDRDFFARLHEAREENSAITPCHGDITLEITPNRTNMASICVESETKNFCPYHFEDELFS